MVIAWVPFWFVVGILHIFDSVELTALSPESHTAGLSPRIEFGWKLTLIPKNTITNEKMIMLRFVLLSTLINFQIKLVYLFSLQLLSYKIIHASKTPGIVSYGIRIYRNEIKRNGKTDLVKKHFRKKSYLKEIMYIWC